MAGRVRNLSVRVSRRLEACAPRFLLRVLRELRVRVSRGLEARAPRFLLRVFRALSPRGHIPEFVAALSGIALYLSFPPRGNPALAWVALSPFLATLAFVPPRRGFRVGLVCGLAFWLPSISWLWALIGNGGPWPLVILGQFGLALYCALYTAAFAWLLAASPHAAAEGWRCRERSAWHGLGRALLAAAVWTGLEWIRSTFLTGFAWNHLGVSQHRSLAILQIASLGGVYAVSALVLLVNAGLAGAVLRIVRSVRGTPGPRHHADLVVALAATLAAVCWGIREQHIWQERERIAPPLCVGAAQPNAPSIFERDDDTFRQTYRRLQERTSILARLHPDLVVWPETVLPGVLPSDDFAVDFAVDAARLCNAPLLVGAVELRQGARKGGRDLVANSSWLFRPNGRMSVPYRKQHLVPFGEYIPLDDHLPFLERLSPVGYSCTAGTNAVLFPVAGRLLGGTNVLVSPLICFEDTVAPLAAAATRQGAAVLVNQSNDSWFTGSSEPAQHHAQAVFRAIETRTPLVRVSNAGVSGVVAASGARSPDSVSFVESVFPRQPGWPVPPYARRGDWMLAIPCALLTLLLTALRGGRAAVRRFSRQ